MSIEGVIYRRFAVVFLTAVFFLSTIGCDESVNPIVGSEYPFTIWGFMNSGADTQYVRVFEISDKLIVDPAAEIDATVFSTNLTTGERRQWEYIRVNFDSTSSGHIFRSRFRAQYLHRYRLEVIRSDGATSSVEVNVPGKVEFDIDVQGNRVTFPIRIDGDAPNLVGPKVTYQAINIPPTYAWPPGTAIHPPVILPVTVSYEEELERQNGSWSLTVNIVTDTTDVRSEFRSSCLITAETGSAPNIWIRNMEFSAVAADSSWSPPGGIFDPDELAVPGTMSNVTNGYGFFGAGQGIRYWWQPEQDVLERAGYSFAGRCGAPPGPLPVPSCMNPPIPCFGENVDDIWTLWLR